VNIPLLAAALLLAAGSIAPAQQPPARNAALDYWRANTVASNTSRSPTPTQESAFSKVPWDAIGANLDPSKMPPEFEAARKQVSPEAMTEFLRGAATPDCDFQPHFEDGWKMLLPELAVVRNLARAARVDARAKLMEGDGHAAAERVEAMYHAASHVARENVLIATLVGAAIASNADDEVKVLAASGKLGDADRQRLLAAIAALKNNDGLHFRSALEGERRVTSSWLVKEYSGPGAPARFVKDLVALSAESRDEDRQLAAQIAALTPEAFADSAKKIDSFYDEVLKAWDSPDPKTALKALNDRLSKGEYGLVARQLAPSLDKAYGAFARCTDHLTAAEEALKKKP
jgi:hypothetical protein